MTGREVAWMVFYHFGISDTDGTVLHLPDLLEAGLRNDSVHSFDTRWDETVIAMKKKTDDEVLETGICCPGVPSVGKSDLTPTPRCRRRKVALN